MSEGSLNGNRRLIVGLDLGQQRDYTAISVTERVLLPTGKFRREPSHFEGGASGMRRWRRGPPSTG